MLWGYEDENDFLWLGTHSKGLNVLRDGREYRFLSGGWYHTGQS